MTAVMMIIVLLPVLPHALAEKNGNAVVNSYQQIDYSAPKPRRISPVTAGTPVPGAASGNGSGQPSRYDARDLGIVHPVRDQGVYGTCWAHAFISSAEINLCMQGLADADEIDLSELQFLYYTYGKYTDPLGNLGNDLNMAMDVSPLDRGGSHLFTALLADRWSGLAAEQIMTYPDDIGFAMNSFILDGKNRYAYAGDSYPAEYGSDFAEAHLKNCSAIPYDDVSGVKQAIMELGCVVSSVYASDNASYLNSVTNAYFQNVRTTPNHAITIIGWDDAYPVGNFGTKYRPKHPGAWLVRNSRGTDWGDEGYFWLSYEDASLRNDFFAYEFDKADKYNYNYQYDGTASKENGLILKYKVRGIFDGAPGRFSLSRAVRFPVEVSLEGFEIPGTVYEEVGLPLMAGEGNEDTPDLSSVEQYKTCRIECIFTPENASDKLVSYFVDDPSIAEVDFDGTITANEPGVATVFVHTRDGNFSQVFTITVTEHKHTWSAGTLVKEATCTENGNTAGIACAVCKNVLAESVTIPAAGHDYVFLEKLTADCRHGGADVYVCKNCGTTEKRNMTDPSDHAYIPVLTKAPTCSEKGYDLYICRYCAQTQYRNEKETLRHEFVLFDAKAPSCTENGYELYECKNCGKLEKCGETPAYGHADINNDGRCDGCGTVLDAEAAHEDCDCICHRTGISALIYKLLNLIWKVFGINRECKCGAMHY